jgi:hypothetical protein
LPWRSQTGSPLDARSTVFQSLTFPVVSQRHIFHAEVGHLFRVDCAKVNFMPLGQQSQISTVGRAFAFVQWGTQTASAWTKRAYGNARQRYAVNGPRRTVFEKSKKLNYLVFDILVYTERVCGSNP